MKKPLAFLMLGLFILVVSGLLTKLWLTNASMLPTIPSQLSEQLTSLYGATNAEDVADLEILIGFGIFTPMVSILTAITWITFKSLWHKKQ